MQTHSVATPGRMWTNSELDELHTMYRPSPAPPGLRSNLLGAVQALVEVVDQSPALEQAELVADRYRKLVAVAAERDHRALFAGQRRALSGTAALGGGDAAGFVGGIVERVHEQLVAALLDRLAILAPHPDGAGEAGDAPDGVALVVVVADLERMDLRAPGQHLRQPEDVALEHP